MESEHNMAREDKEGSEITPTANLLSNCGRGTTVNDILALPGTLVMPDDRSVIWSSCKMRKIGWDVSSERLYLAEASLRGKSERIPD